LFNVSNNILRMLLQWQLAFVLGAPQDGVCALGGQLAMRHGVAGIQLLRGLRESGVDQGFELAQFTCVFARRLDGVAASAVARLR
jgi:hypothetical protein